MYSNEVIIHSTVPSESYVKNDDGGWELISDNKQRSKYKGYLKNVVLNKILILNSFWPFVLKTPLNADLVIGIDVKNNTAGFTLINKNGAEITFHYSESEQKEQLSKSQIRTEIIRLIRREQELSFRNIKDIVIHRQGKLFIALPVGKSLTGLTAGMLYKSLKMDERRANRSLLTIPLVLLSYVPECFFTIFYFVVLLPYIVGSGGAGILAFVLPKAWA